MVLLESFRGPFSKDIGPILAWGKLFQPKFLIPRSDDLSPIELQEDGCCILHLYTHASDGVGLCKLMHVS